MGKLRLRPDCEYCGRNFTRKNKRALSVSFKKRPKKLNKCQKCDRKCVKFTLRLGLLQDAKRRAANGDDGFGHSLALGPGTESTAQSASLHSVRQTHNADVVLQPSQVELNSTDGSDIIVHDNKPPLVGDAKPGQSYEVSSKAKKRGKFRCPICPNVALRRKHNFIRHIRSHYRNRSLLKPANITPRKSRNTWCKTGDEPRPDHAAHDGIMEQVAEALDEDSIDTPKIKEIAFHKAVLLTAALWAEYVKNWQSIRSHRHAGVTHNQYNFRLTSMDLCDLFPSLRRVFADQPGAFKFNISFAFILRHRTSGVHRYVHANDDTARFFETAMPVQTMADFGEVLNALAVQNLYQWTVNKRIRSSWHVTIVTNATAVVSREQ